MTSHRLFLVIAAVLGFIAIVADAGRPCKTIIFVSTSFSVNENPNFPLQNPNPSFLTLYFTDAREINSNNFISYKSNRFFADRRAVKSPQLAGDFDSSAGNSIRDRTLDIVSIVGALLFGVGSGALTAGTMYLIWSMFTPRRFDFGVESDDDEEEDEYSPKKMGYVAVAAAAADTGVTGAKQVE